ncbi:hypothetical protein H5999_08155, partial [[Clostridium] spiroforme]|nr:hypothetical protein [Thomasclavelia spiroformis]
GVTYSKEEYKVEVSVSDAGNGQLQIDKKVTKDGEDVAGIVFTNIYKIFETEYKVDDVFKLKKELIGKAWANETFKFNITQISGPTSVQLEHTTVDVSKPASGNIAEFTFGDMTFTELGTYVFEVNEEKGNIDGLSYSNQKAIITIDVTDNLVGGFAHSLTVQNDIFYNVYTYGTISGLQIEKTLSGLDMKDGEFTFVITAKDTASANKAGMETMSTTISNSQSTQVNGTSSDVMTTLLNNMTFKSEDNGKVYEFTISEQKGDKDYIIYDNSQYHVTIAPTVVDDITTIKTTVEKDGQTKEYNNEVVKISFANKYDASTVLGPSGNVQINATKELVNGNLKDKQFTFNVLNSKNQIVSTGSNDSNGKVSFGDIKYTMDQILADVHNGIATKNKENNQTVYNYKYTVKESDLPNGITAIEGEFIITVKITDNGEGQLSINVIYPNNSNNTLSFKNEYGKNEVQTVIINGSKNLTADEGTLPPLINDKYTFTMKVEDITPEEYRKDKDGNVITRSIVPQPSDLVQKNDSANSIRFGEIKYDMSIFKNVVQLDDGTRKATFKYTITETGKVDGITNDKNTSRAVIVNVTDNGDGTLSVEVENNGFEFTNHYSVDPKDSSITDVSSGIALNKTLVGRDLIKDEFEFIMTDQTGITVSTGTNDESGNIKMTPITFTKEGTYNFNLYEKQNGKGGVVYDNTLYVAKAHVVDQHNGQLNVSWELYKDNVLIQNANFENTYSAKETTVNIKALKKLEGRSIKDNEFTFELTDQNGQVVEKVQNDVNGNIQFSTLTFDKAGTYTYTISEVKGDDKDITYDNSKKNVTVTVTDDGLGQLNAVVASDELVFTNTYTQPAVEGIETGDAIQVLEWLSTAIFSGILILVVYKKKMSI